MAKKDKDLQIYCMTYKIPEYGLVDDVFHTPIHVGKEQHKDEYVCELGDNTGDNISWQNPWMMETTGMYWVWKNKMDTKYIGQEQYRRRWPLDCKYVKKILKDYEIIVPSVKTFPMTIEQHYAFCHNITDLWYCEAIIKEKYPEMAEEYDKIIKKGNQIYTYNSFITTKENYDEICKFIFDVLLTYCKIKGYKTQEEWIEYAAGFNKNVYITHNEITMAEYQSRICGYLSERLMTFFLMYRFKNRFECTMLPMEKNID